MDTAQLKEEIVRLKKEKNVLILAHTYQIPDVLDIADVTGDSYALSVAATKYDAPTVLLCGVRFMAETVKILSPEKKVILSEVFAGCPMALQIAPERVAEYRKEHPDHAIVTYINTTAKLKAECDVCVTSSTAVKIVSRLPQKDILFIPDQNLGAYVAAQLPEKNIILWDGYCFVHARVTADDVQEAKKLHPQAKVAAHPECVAEVLALADMVGSTSAIIDYALKTEGEVILVTERGVGDYLSREYPERSFIQLVPDKLVCKNMKMTDLQSVHNALTGAGGYEIKMDEELRLRAKRSIDNMLSIGG